MIATEGTKMSGPFRAFFTGPGKVHFRFDLSGFCRRGGHMPGVLFHVLHAPQVHEHFFGDECATAYADADPGDHQ